MIDPRVASGLRDIPPSVMIPREKMLATFRETFASFGFLPILEDDGKRYFVSEIEKDMFLMNWT